MNLIFGQKETLPNIVGTAYINAISGVEGCFTKDDPPGYPPSTFRSDSGFSPRIKMDASLTVGTGSGVYKNGAHVQPNTVTTKMWLRNA